MKINKTLLVSALMLGGALSSCDLEEKYYSQTTVDNFVDSEITLNQILTRPFNHWAYVVKSYIVEVNEQSADCFVWPARSTGDGWDGPDRPNMRNHEMTVNDGWANNGWKESLQGVARCIDLIEKIEAIDYKSIGVEEEKKSQHLGQIKALMGFFYMVAMDWYGGVPIYESTQDALRPRSTVKETFDYTENLLVEAVENLPVRSSLNEEVTGFLRKASAAMLLARLYFNAESYIGVQMFDKAEKICQDILNGVYGQYELESDWQALFGFSNHNSAEIMWGVPADWSQMKNEYFVVQQFPYNIYKYFGLSTDFSTFCWNGLCLTPSRDPEYKLYKETRPDIKLGSPYEKFDDGDLRKKCYRYLGNGKYEGMFLIGVLADPDKPERVCDFLRPFRQGEPEEIYDKIGAWSRLVENGGTVVSKADLKSEFYDCADESDGVRLVKYPIPDESDYRLYGTCCVPYMRLSEVYYTLAECKLRKGDKQGAADLINQVRKRYFEGGVDPNPATAANMDQWRMLDEWLIEFLGEGRRRTDLIRWGVFHTAEWWDHLPKNDKNVCRMPLGSSVIGSNNLLKQNPGYGGNELSSSEI